MTTGHYKKIYKSDLSHRARAVCMYLKDHADKEGKCWPGIRTISADLCLSRSTVRGAILGRGHLAALVSGDFSGRRGIHLARGFLALGGLVHLGGAALVHIWLVLFGGLGLA